MVRIPYIKIPSVRVGSIVPTSNIGTGGATPAPPTPITYLTQWKIVGNSEVHGQEIWSCGEYNATDGKYHILVQPQGGSIVDIALYAPLRKINDVADTIEFPSDTEGKALVTRLLKEVNITSCFSKMEKNNKSDFYRIIFSTLSNKKLNNNVFMAEYTTAKSPYTSQNKGMACSTTIPNISLYDERFNQSDSNAAFREYLQDAKLIYELATPTTELVDAPQIAEADSYSCVISQGAKAVEWSSFITNSE